MKSRMIGVDIGKEVFHLVGFAADGKIAFRRRIRRLGLKDVFNKLPPCIVAMEACLSSHFVSRTRAGSSGSDGHPASKIHR
jgi:transposase